MTRPTSPLGTPAELKEAFEAGLAEYYVVGLYFRFHDRVVIPQVLQTQEWLSGRELIQFEYGLDMPVPIDDLQVTEDGVSATLSFNRVSCHTFVPWEAVVTMGGGGLRPKQKPTFKLVT